METCGTSHKTTRFTRVLRGDSIVVVGGIDEDDKYIAVVEILRYDSETGEYISKDLPPLACGPVIDAVVLPIIGTASAEGQVTQNLFT